MRIIRLADREDIPKTEFQLELRRFMTQVELLFGKGQCIKLSGTYTGTMIATLKEPIVLIQRGHATTLGGLSSVTDDILTRCLARMQNWIRLARGVMSAECPDYDVIASLGAFNLKEDTIPDLEHFIKTLAKILKLDNDALLAQTLWLRPVALYLFKSTGITAEEAWKQACLRRFRDKTKPAELQSALQRLLGWGISTSGVERTFATNLWLCGSSRSELSDATISNELRIYYGDPADDEKVCEMAQLEWARVYSCERQASKGSLNVFRGFGVELTLVG